jgi:hypothetical protein
MQTEFRLDVALLHYPVINRNNEIIGSAITNLDLHDIARAGRTFGVNTYWVITPDARQQELALQIVEHWTKGYGGTVNTDRASALSLIQICSGIDEALSSIAQSHGTRPLLIATSAMAYGKGVTYAGLKEKLDQGCAAVIMFGTAWGIAPEVREKVDFFLPPIGGAGTYNHLSVRSAASIILDRLIGNREQSFAVKSF